MTVIAAVRELSTTSAKALSTIPKAPNSRLITIKIDSTSLTDALVAVQNLQLEHGITQLDVVVANAGIGTTYGLLMDATASQIQDHVNVNAIGRKDDYASRLHGQLLTQRPRPFSPLPGRL